MPSEQASQKFDSFEKDLGILDLIFQLMNEPFLLLNQQGKVVNVTQSLVEALNLAKSSFVGQNIFDWVHPEDIRTTLKKLANLTTYSNAVESLRCRLRTSSGDFRLFSWDLCHNHQQNIILISLENLTQKSEKAQEQTLERRKALQSARQACLVDMAAGVAHEINNPLTIISGHLSLVEKASTDPDKLSQKIKTIQNSVDRISDIVRALRKFSQPKGSRTHTTNTLSDLVDSSLVAIHPMAKKYSTPIYVEGDGSGYIQCYDIDMIQVIIHLVRNALEATSSLSKRWVKILKETKETSVHLFVVDAGLGIPPELHEKIFEPFFTQKIATQAAGLGLTMVRNILSDHGATVELVAEQENTCFKVSFPRYPLSKKPS